MCFEKVGSVGEEFGETVDAAVDRQGRRNSRRVSRGVRRRKSVFLDCGRQLFIDAAGSRYTWARASETGAPRPTAAEMEGGLMSCPIQWCRLRRRRRRCVPSDLSCTADIAGDPGQSVAGNVRNNPAAVVGLGSAHSATPGSAPGFPYGGGCRESRNGGCVENHPEEHAAGSAAKTRQLTGSWSCGAAGVYSPCRRR